MSSLSAIENAAKKVSHLESEITFNNESVLNFEDRLRHAFVSSSAEIQNEYSIIMSKLNDVSYITKPEGLLDLQVRLGEYQQKVETVLAFTRKGVSTIETVLRA